MNTHTKQKQEKQCWFNSYINITKIGKYNSLQKN